MHTVEVGTCALCEQHLEVGGLDGTAVEHLWQAQNWIGQGRCAVAGTSMVGLHDVAGSQMASIFVQHTCTVVGMEARMWLLYLYGLIK